MIYAEELLAELKEIKRLLAIQTMDPKYWEFKVESTDTPFVVPRGQVKDIIDLKETGKVLAIIATVNSPNIYVEVEIDGQKLGKRVVDLKNAGLDSYNPETFWIAKWDETNNIFTVCLTPAFPRMYFGRITFRIYAPRDQDVTVTYTIHRFRLKTELI